MKFEAMLAFWKMKDTMIKHNGCITRDKMYESDALHVTYSMIISNGSLHANILYRYSDLNGIKSKFALIYADILFSGFPEPARTAQVFKMNATVADLRREFIEDSVVQSQFYHV